MGDQVAGTLMPIRPIGGTMGILLPDKNKHQQSELRCPLPSILKNSIDSQESIQIDFEEMGICQCFWSFSSAPYNSKP